MILVRQHGFFVCGPGLIAAILVGARTLAAAPAPKSDADLLALPKWDNSVSTRLSAGYKDNILLGRHFADESPFLTGGLDWMLFRLPTDKVNFYLFATGDYTRYLAARHINYEANALAQTQFKYSPSPRWDWLLTAQYFYLDEIIDVSAFYRDFTALKVRGHNFSGQPIFRYHWNSTWWSDAQFDVERDLYGLPLDNQWEYGPKLTLGHSYRNNSEWLFSYEIHRRTFDTRLASNSTGAPLQAPLAMVEHEFGLQSRHYWDKRRYWRSATKLFAQRNVDVAAGYYSFWRGKLGEELRYKPKKWDLRAEFDLLQYWFDVQTISAFSTEKRVKTLATVTLRGERAISKSWKIFANYEYDQSISNLSEDEYRANSFSAGLEWEH